MGQDPYNNLEDPYFKESLSRVSQGLDEFVIDPSVVKDILMKLPTKSGPGPDGIPHTA